MAREMKDSGVEWIGEIPKEWEIVRTKNEYFFHKNVVGNKADDYMRLALTLNGVIRRSKEDSNGLQPEVFTGYQIIKEGELVFKLIDLENLATSRVGLSPYTGLVSPAYIVLEPRKSVNSKFGEYFFLSMWQREIFNHMGDAGVRSSLIKCLELNNIIFKTRESIAEYKKLKQAVITQAVTQGIRGDREMKDSCNIRWGKIPSDWNLIRIKNCIIDLKSGLSSVTNDENAGESGYYVLRTSAVSSGVFLPKEVKSVLTSAINRLVCPVEKDTIVVSRMNTSAMVGTCAYVDNEYPNLFLPDKLWKIHVKKEYYTKYFWYAINSIPARSLFDEISTGASMSMQNISVTDFVNNYVTVPPLEEQREIVHYLDQKCSAIDNLIAKKEQYLSEIESYKKSLIYEYVTGKKEVPQEYQL